MPQIIAGNHVLIGAESAAEMVIFLFQIRCAELTTDGFVLCQLRLDRRQLCGQRLNFCFQIGNRFLRFFQQFLQLALLLFLHHILLRRCDEILVILTINGNLGSQRQGLGFDLLYSLNGNLLLLNTLDALSNSASSSLRFSRLNSRTLR